MDDEETSGAERPTWRKFLLAMATAAFSELAIVGGVGVVFLKSKKIN